MYERLNSKRALLAAALLATMGIAGCGDDDAPSDPSTSSGAGATGATGGNGQGGGDAGGSGPGGSGSGGNGGGLDIAVCDPGAGPFSAVIDNDFFPLEVGQKWVYDGEEDGATLHLEITVLDETEMVASVETRVVEENEQEDGELVEISRNFFVQAPDGTVCYYGEDVDIYEGGRVVAHEGQWRAGEMGALPGIQMPAMPAVGMAYDQEIAPGIAEDHAEVVAMGEPIEVPAGMFTDTLETEESSPLEPGATSRKVYARGVGLLVDSAAELTSY